MYRIQAEGTLDQAVQARVEDKADVQDLLMGYCKNNPPNRVGTSAIKSFYDSKRANAPWWCGFERRAWNAKSMVDYLGPIVVAVVAVMVI